MPDEQTVYIAGPGHSGSTLLDMLLGGHKEVSALGEIHRFYLSLHKQSRPHCCDCGKPLRECEFWQAVLSRLEHITGMSRDTIIHDFVTTDPANLEISDDNTILTEPVAPRRYRLDLSRMLAGVAPLWVYRFASRFHSGARLYRRMAKNSHQLFDAVREVAGTPIIVDSTKNPIRLRTLFAERPGSFKIVYVIRDGRAVTHSRLRRHDISMSAAARVWVAEHRKQSIVQRDLDPENIFRIRYEDLCTDTTGELTRLCDFLGIQFNPEVLSFREITRHAIGGNPMRFRKGDRKIELRERWRDDLTSTQLDEFEAIGGGLNRSLGYE